MTYTYTNERKKINVNKSGWTGDFKAYTIITIDGFKYYNTEQIAMTEKEFDRFIALKGTVCIESY